MGEAQHRLTVYGQSTYYFLLSQHRETSPHRHRVGVGPSRLSKLLDRPVPWLVSHMPRVLKVMPAGLITVRWSDVRLSSQLLEQLDASKDVAGVFKHWQTTMKKPRVKLIPKRQRLIGQRLKEYSSDELKAAIDGCARSRFHMGENERGCAYNWLDQILRSDKHIDQFINMKRLGVGETGDVLDRLREVTR